MTFKDWLESHGCQVEVTQEDDGSGYVCLEVYVPPVEDRNRYDVTVSV